MFDSKVIGTVRLGTWDISLKIGQRPKRAGYAGDAMGNVKGRRSRRNSTVLPKVYQCQIYNTGSGEMAHVVVPEDAYSSIGFLQIRTRLEGAHQMLDRTRPGGKEG